jgi:hypothetical protein
LKGIDPNGIFPLPSKLQYLVQDDTCALIRQYYNEEQRLSAITCKVAHMQLGAVQNAELLYQKKVECLLHDQNCFKILIVWVCFCLPVSNFGFNTTGLFA